MSPVNIFLSYARSNASLAVDLERALQVAGAVVWRDQEQLYAGAHWPKDLGEAVSAQDALVLVWTEPAARSKFVELEWCTALALGKPVLPYLADDTPLPAVLASFHGLQAESPDSDAPRLIQRLQKQPRAQGHDSNWLLTALENIPTNEPERVFRTVRGMLATAAATTMGATIAAPGDAEFPLSPFRAGAVIGGRYEIKSLLGRGGMGEVWRAFDLKLRVDVALKVLYGATDEKSVEALRSEVRTAREVISPNVCRIFDLGEVDGIEFLSMEFVDGKTVTELMAEKGPLQVDAASPLASQLLSSLQDIHQAGLVHRDVKPENLMVTRTGRLVLMDLGLARLRSDDGVYSVSGTPAYMSPEQLRGDRVDARSDVYAAGIVLAELTAPAGARNLAERQAVWSGIQRDPPSLPETPWASVLARAVARDPERRYSSAQDLARALEKETVRTVGGQEASPYPGLASFTEAEAEYFFGREAEVEALWKKLAGQPRLLGVVGPSGAGKSSFLRAGVVAARPEGWITLRINPGGNPFVALGQALARAIPNDPLLAEQMVRFNEPDVAVELIGRWARSEDEALLIIDQFEELFTQNPEPMQETFSRLLSRLPVEAEVHVVLGMRDDFLMACHQHESLAPVFSELTPLEAPSGEALRRAIVQPALKCGYRFEDDALVDEMIGAVEGERGALPLLAFACERLWEGRDCERGLLTRDVYENIGGVAGALAGHAEATLERIGSERLPLVRELFRNLVTSQRTRAEQDQEELLSVFPEEAQSAAAEVLGELVDARLLVSYEDHGEDAERHRIEIIHESLLETWPRLVRWQTQDADAAQMRDQLRQAARLWEARERSVDMLWSGTAFKEFDLWREKYPGRLSDTEQAFARAMVDHAHRRRRLRRAAAGAVFVALLLVIGVVGRFWLQSEEARKETEAALSASQANRLAALGRLNELNRNPSAAIGYVIASLEHQDTQEARQLALEALWRGPTALVFKDSESPGAPMRTRFSHDGRWLAVGRWGGEVGMYERDSGSEPMVTWKAHEAFVNWAAFNRAASWLCTTAVTKAASEMEARWWSVPGGELLREERIPFPMKAPEDEDSVAAIWLRDGIPEVSFYPQAGEPQVEYLKTGLPLQEDPQQWMSKAWADPDGQWLATVEDGALVARPLGRNLAGTRRFSYAEDEVSSVSIREGLLAVALAGGVTDVYSLKDKGTDPLLTFTGPAKPDLIEVRPKNGALFSWNIESGDARLWRFDGPEPVVRNLPLDASANSLVFDDETELLATTSFSGIGNLWPLRGPAVVEPTLLQRGAVGQGTDLDFHPDGPWLAIAENGGLSLRPLNGPHARLLWRHPRTLVHAVFAPDGRWLAVSGNRTIRIWPLEGEPLPPSRELSSASAETYYLDLDTDLAGEWIVAGAERGRAALISVRSGEVVNLEGFASQAMFVAMSPDGRLAAAAGGQAMPEERQIRIWAVESGEEIAVLDAPDGQWPVFLKFCANQGDLNLYSSSRGRIWKWDLATESAEVVWSSETEADGKAWCLVDNRVMVLARNEEKQPVLLDLESGEESVLRAHSAPGQGTFAIDSSGTIVASADQAGAISVSHVDGGEPHLLLGHDGAIRSIAIDPAGRWIASVGQDQTVRLWPMPDLSRTPFHKLPHDEFLTRLKALTNYRVVADESDPSGFKVTTVPFDGWAQVPEWW